jgi:CBS-domain-containing membrane protein
MTSPAVSGTTEQTVRDAQELVRGRAFFLLPVTNADGTLAGIVPVARLRAAADATTPLSALLEPAHTVRSDAPLIRSIVQMNDAGVRQFVVVDHLQGTRVVGVIAVGDFVRAHARAAPAPDEVSVARTSQPSRPLTVRAKEVMTPAQLVPGATPLEALLGQFASSASKALIVDSGDGEYGVVLAENVRELGRDDDLQRVLIAADVAHKAPRVRPGADLAELVRIFSEGGADAVIVQEPDAGTPLGVVTRTKLGALLLESHAAQLRAGSEGRAPLRP